MNFKKYLNISTGRVWYNPYNEYYSDKRSLIWGWDEDVFLKNTFAQAYYTKDKGFIRDIKLSMLLNEIPECLKVLDIIKEYPPIATAISPAFNLTYKSDNNSLFIYSVAIATHNKLIINPERDYIIHSITNIGIRYSEIPKLDWMIPIDEKRNIQFQKLGI
jgi:hypothetical protein